MEGVAALDRRHHDTTSDTNKRVQNAEHSADIRTNKLIKCAIISTTIAVFAVLCGCFGALYVYKQGPTFLGLVPDSYGVQSYSELLAGRNQDARLHDEDVAIHDKDVAIHNEDCSVHDEDVRLNRDLADENAVLRSQIGWLRHSHNVFKAVLGKDKERLHRGGAWEFAQKNWKQNELDFVTSYFDKLAKVDERYIEFKTHQQNKLNFMFACFFDSEKEIKNVNLSNLPDNWHHFYQPVIDRLQETNATNVLEYIHGSSLLRRASNSEKSLGAGE